MTALTNERTKDLLIHHREHLEILAKELLEKEILFQADLERLIGKRPFENQTTYQKFTNGTDKVETEEKKEETPAPADLNGEVKQEVTGEIPK